METLGLEGRASYYDRTGALKDVVQNHLLQVLCLVAMEPPLSLNQGDLVNQKVDLLRSVRPLAPDQVKYHTRRGRYTAGLSAETGEALHRYIDEEGMDADRNTETYAEVMLEAGNWRWQGTRFRLAAERRWPRAVRRWPCVSGPCRRFRSGRWAMNCGQPAGDRHRRSLWAQHGSHWDGVGPALTPDAAVSPRDFERTRAARPQPSPTGCCDWRQPALHSW